MFLKSWYGAAVVLISAMAVSPVFAQTWAAQHSAVPIGSAPALAIEDNSLADIFEPSWAFEVFYRGWNQQLWNMDATYVSSATPYSSPGVTLFRDPDTLVWKGKVVVFYMGANGHLFIASKKPFEPQQPFTNAVDTGYGTLTSSPSAGSVDGKTEDVFFRGGNGHLWEMHFKDLKHWSAPEDLGGVVIQSRPSVVVMPDQKNKKGYQVLYVGPNGHLWKSYWPSDLKKRIWWSAPEDLGGLVVTGGPVSTTLLSNGAPTGRGIQTFYLTDSARGTDRLWYSRWVGYDKHGNTDWWSGPQQLVVTGADFTSDLGTTFFNAFGTEIVYRDGHGHYANFSWIPPAPPPAPPTITLSATPDNGYVSWNQAATVNWQVGNCTGTCTVTLTGRGGLGYSQVVLNEAGLPISGGFSVTPRQDLKFTFTATGSNGMTSKSIQVTLAPSPQACASCGYFYFIIKANSPDAVTACFTEAVPAQSSAQAQGWLQSENPDATVTPTDENGFYSGCDD